MNNESHYDLDNTLHAEPSPDDRIDELEEKVKNIENWLKGIAFLVGFVFVAVLFLIFG